MYDMINFNDYKCYYCIPEDVGVTNTFTTLKFPDDLNNVWEYDVAIVSDTHNYHGTKQVFEKFEQVGIKNVIHAGDIGSAEMLEIMLEAYSGKMYGVLGNHDRMWAAGFLYYKNKYADRLTLEYNHSFQVLGRMVFHIYHENDE